MTAQASVLTKALASFADGLPGGAAPNFVDHVTSRFKAAADGPELQGQLERIYLEELTALAGRMKDADAEALQKLRDADTEYQAKMGTALDKILFKPRLTFEYAHNQPANEAKTSTFRLIYSKAAGGKESHNPQFNFNLNFAATIYESVPTGLNVGRWRDVQAGAPVPFRVHVRFESPPGGNSRNGGRESARHRA